MSLARAAGPILATICGVCTAYVTIAPELQKQAAERQFGAQHSTDSTNTTSPPNSDSDSPLPSSSSTSSPDPSANTQQAQQDTTLLAHEHSLGKDVRHAVHHTKSELAASVPTAGWFGIGTWSRAFGGAEKSPREAKEGDHKKEEP